jgi:hypothetical protein
VRAAGGWIAVLAALLSPAAPAPLASASIAGAIVVAIHSASLKHWGVPGAQAAFVPDSDESDSARDARAAADGDALCAVLSRLDGRDREIALATIDGDGDLEHRSGEEAHLRFTLTVAAIGRSTPGVLVVCSRPLVAVVGRGNYPDERFQTVEGHRLWWPPRRLTLRPGEQTQVRLTADIDASDW